MAAPRRPSIDQIVSADMAGRSMGETKPKATRRKKAYTILLDEIDLDRLKAYADQNGISVNGAVRKAIKELIR